MELKAALIFVKDIERMTAFYRDGLGLRVLPEKASEGWVEFAAGDAALALHSIPSDIAKDIKITTPPEPRSNTAIKLVFEVLDLGPARAHLIAHGAVMHEPHRWNGCAGLDPEGNVFQIVEKKER